VSYQELVLKLLDGITDAPMRADVAATVTMLVELYMVGKIDDRKLLSALRELVTDVLMTKNPFRSAEEIKDEVDKWVEALYRAVKIKAVKMRLGAE
jgi:ATP-dependent Lon protease